MSRDPSNLGLLGYWTGDGTGTATDPRTGKEVEARLLTDGAYVVGRNAEASSDAGFHAGAASSLALFVVVDVPDDALTLVEVKLQTTYDPALVDPTLADGWEDVATDRLDGSSPGAVDQPLTPDPARPVVGALGTSSARLLNHQRVLARATVDPYQALGPNHEVRVYGKAR